MLPALGKSWKCQVEHQLCRITVTACRQSASHVSSDLASNLGCKPLPTCRRHCVAHIGSMNFLMLVASSPSTTAQHKEVPCKHCTKSRQQHRAKAAICSLTILLHTHSCMSTCMHYTCKKQSHGASGSSPTAIPGTLQIRWPFSPEAVGAMCHLAAYRCLARHPYQTLPSLFQGHCLLHCRLCTQQLHREATCGNNQTGGTPQSGQWP